MFRDLHDAICFLSSSRWPEAMGEVTAFDLERAGGRNGHLRLAVASKFSIKRVLTPVLANYPVTCGIGTRRTKMAWRRFQSSPGDAGCCVPAVPASVSPGKSL